MIQMMALSKLIVDETLYPRTRINAYNVRSIQEAIAAGAEMPDIVIDTKCRIIDGVHRFMAYLHLFRKQLTKQINVEVLEVDTDAAFFIEAGRLNANHGQKMTTIDRVHFALRAKELGVGMPEIAKAIHMKQSDVKKLLNERSASSLGGPAKPIKQSITHLKGQRLSDEQWDANTKLSGMPLHFHANQVKLFIDSEFVDTDDSKNLKALWNLKDALDRYLASVEPSNGK